MARWLTRSLCLAVLLAGCTTAGQQSARAPSSNERLRLAAAAEGNNNLEVALSIYRNAAQADPENAEVQSRYASALARHGAHAEAVLVLEQALARRPRDRALLLALARTQLRANDLRSAAQSFSRVIEQAPQDPDALNGLGVIADLSGDHRLAQERYHEGLRRAPQHEGLRNNLALSLALTGATGEAMQLLQAIRREGNTDVRVRHNLAFVSAMAGDPVTARQLSGAELDAVDQQNLVSAAALMAAASQGAERGAAAPAAERLLAAPVRQPPSVAPVRAETEPPAPRTEIARVPPSPEPAPAEPARAAAAPTVASPPSAPDAAPPTVRDARMVLQARADAWVQVRERDSGSVVFDRVLRTGESYRVPDRPGLLLTTGNAAGLLVVADGEPLPPLGGEGVVRRDLPLDAGTLRQAIAARFRPAAAPVAAPLAVPAPMPAADTRVVLNAQGETWVLVRARESGEVLFDRLMRAGETYRVPDRSGLIMTTGNAAGLQVVIDGEPLPPLGGERVVRRDLPLDPVALRQAARPQPRAPEPAPTLPVQAEPARPSVHADTPPPGPHAARIVLRALGETWVQVRERDSGAVLFDRVLRAGDRYPVPGRPGLLLTTGNAAGLEVMVEGEVLPSLGGEGVVRRDMPLDPAALRRAVVVGAR
ncbi:RodZ domain-containing protein [Elioraea sp.]|uniref:RodZ domain-containing protein n=1 Tax=Elioraea sp. TaxID=2185103 RepID=UPI003F72A0FA